MTTGLAGASSSVVAAFTEGEAVIAVSVPVVVDDEVDEGGGGGTFASVGRFVGGFTSTGVVSFSSAQSDASIQENPSLQKKSSPS